ncbi:MAG: hypothetical protein ABW196_08105 [Solirubrobacterales bacterium]
MPNLKILGLVLAALTAIAALAVFEAGAPSAQTLTTTEFTTESDVGTTVTSEVAAGTVHEFTVGTRSIVCKKFHFEGGLPGKTTEMTIGVPKYEECSTTPFLGVSLAVTMTPGDCHYVLTGEETVGLKYGISIDVVCEGAEDMTFHVKNGSSDVCTVTMGPQAITGLWMTNVAGAPDHIVLHSDKKTIVKATIHGALCGGTAETNKEFDATYESTTRLTGSQGGKPAGLTVSHLVV